MMFTSLQRVNVSGWTVC